MLLGAIIGLERERKEHGAGMRTLALVSLGSALFTIISAYGFLDLLGIPRLTLDPTRIASYIVAGIGFLGAGTIFMSREQERVRGLTTAATIWVIAAIGMACGAGLIVESIATVALVLIVLVVLQYVEDALLVRFISRSHRLYIEATLVTGPLIARVYEICAHNKVTIEKVKVLTEDESEAITVTAQFASEKTLAKVVDQLHALQDVKAVHVDQLRTSAKVHAQSGSSKQASDQ